MNKLRFSLIALLALSSGLAWSLPIQAEGGLGLTPKPTANEPDRSWFVYTLHPGTSQTDTMLITNNSEKSINVAVEALDAINTSEGGFALIDSPSQNQDLGLWVTTEVNSIKIPAGKSVEVDFTLKIPENATPGQHSGAIVIYEKAENLPSGVGLKIRIGARIYVTVPGKVVRKLIFEKVSHQIKDGKLLFHIQARNESNVNIEPALDINLRSIFGSYHQEETNNGNFLPNSTIVLNKTWKKHTPLIGYYRAYLTLHTWSVDEILADGSKKTLPNMTFKYSFGFWVGRIYIFMLALFLILGWCGWRLKVYLKDRKKFQTKTETYTVSKGESIIHVSERSGTLPQLIVKFNQLVWPYALNMGDKLTIPIRPLTPEELYRKQQTETMPSLAQYLLSLKSSLYHPRITIAKQPQPSARLSAKKTSSKRKKK